MDISTLKGLTSCVYSPEWDRLYFNSSFVDLRKHEWNSYPKKIDGYVLPSLDGRGNIYIAGSHTLYILSPDMNLLSYHRFKGYEVNYYLNQAGNMCLITYDDYTGAWTTAKKGIVSDVMK